jgi:hypothetical protein
MHQIGGAAKAHDKAYGYSQPYTDVFQQTYRATSIWQIQNAETKTPAVTLLYGETALPKWNTSTQTFQSAPTGFTPLFGPSGYGNLYNNYTWSGAVFQNRIFFGTEDWGFEQTFTGLPQAAPHLTESSSTYGADLWRFDSFAPAVAEDITGLGNSLNTGIRSMHVSPDGQDLVLGTANAMNLAPAGGWELWLLH